MDSLVLWAKKDIRVHLVRKGCGAHKENMVNVEKLANPVLPVCLVNLVHLVQKVHADSKVSKVLQGHGDLMVQLDPKVALDPKVK